MPDDTVQEERRSSLTGRRCTDHCLSHEANIVILENHAHRLTVIEDMQPVSFNQFKWIIGIIASIFLSLFTISIYNSQKAITALHAIQLDQQRALMSIEEIKEDVQDIKQKIPGG